MRVEPPILQERFWSCPLLATWFKNVSHAICTTLTERCHEETNNFYQQLLPANWEDDHHIGWFDMTSTHPNPWENDESYGKDLPRRRC